MQFYNTLTRNAQSFLIFIYLLKAVASYNIVFCYTLNTLGTLDTITFFIKGLTHQRFSTDVFFKFISSFKYLSDVYRIFFFNQKKGQKNYMVKYVIDYRIFPNFWTAF